MAWLKLLVQDWGTNHYCTMLGLTCQSMHGLTQAQPLASLLGQALGSFDTWRHTLCGSKKRSGLEPLG